MSISEKIVRNTLFTGAGRLWGMLISFLIIPFIVSKLGIDRFGIWVVVSVIVNYFGLLDFGVGSAVVKFTAEYYARKNYHSINKMVNTSLAFYAALSLLTIFPIIFHQTLLHLFQISPEMNSEASFVLIGALLIFILSFTFNPFGNILIGLQRMDISNVISIIFSIINAIGVIVTLTLGYGLRGLIVNSAIVNGLTLTTQFIYVNRLLPNLKIGISHVSFRAMKVFFGYGIKVQVSGLAGTINFQLDKLLLGGFLNVGYVALYELGSKVATFIRNIPMLFLPPIMPAASELRTINNLEDLNKLYWRASKYIVLFSTALAFFIAGSAPIILFVWLGKFGYESSILTIRILSIGYFFNIVTGVITSVARGIGVPQYEMRSSTLMVIMNTVLSIILILKIGFPGALIGTAFSMTLGNIYYIHLFHSRQIKQSIFQLAKKIYLKPLLAGSLGVLIVLAGQHLFLNKVFIFAAERINYFLFLIAEGVIFTVFYIFFLYKSRYINQSDFKLARQVTQQLSGLS